MKTERILENRTLRVSLDPKRPVVLSYLHLATGTRIAGADPDAGILVINGVPVPWENLEIEASFDAAAAAYRVHEIEQDTCLTLSFSLDESQLELTVTPDESSGTPLSTIGWENLPVLRWEDPEVEYWRLFTGEQDFKAMGKMWLRERGGRISGTDPEPAPVPLIYGTLYKRDTLCAFVDSSSPLFPQLHRIDGRGCTVALNTHAFRVRSIRTGPLTVKVVFLEDLNGDGSVDLDDYRLWVNRRLPDADPIYGRSIWYKILCSIGDQYSEIGVSSTWSQAEEIITAIRNVTDGLPQIVYFVGWQAGGHDANYPSLDGYNNALGSEKELRELAARAASELDTIVSYHANIDDVYAASKDYDERLVGAFYGKDGTRFNEATDEVGTVFGGMCHTRDAESGEVFRRLSSMLATVPVSKTLHFDNVRITNCDPAAGPDGIGILEELVCGLMPVMEWLKARGITVTTEGFNGMPADPSLVFDGFWHNDPTPGSQQIFHRKLVGGGRGDHYGNMSAIDLGLGSSIHQDFTYRAIDRESLGDGTFDRLFPWLAERNALTTSFERNWDAIVDVIYRGTLLYHFYLEREMLSWEKIGGGYRVVYSDGVTAEIALNDPDSLLVRWKDVVVARNGDRFIPRDGSVYCYSLSGSSDTWVLPGSLRGKELDAYTLTSGGRGPAPEFAVEGDRIRLVLPLRQPVRIVAR